MLTEIIKTFFKTNFSKPPKRIAVAVSGGVDSLALTLLLRDFCVANNIELFAVTVDHKMRKASSTEALALYKILYKSKITHEILTINKKDLPKVNIEASLREARYDLLYDFCIVNKIEHLFLGHHIGDIAENFLIRLFRGSQLDGLSVMQEVSGFKKIKLCRPLLDVQKTELKKYLEARKIKWFEDETNDDEKFLRNKIRKFFEQFEDKDLIQKRIKSASETIKESKDFIDETMLREASDCLAFEQEGSFLIDVKKYQKISPKIALKILSLVLIEASGKPYKPRLEGLKNFEQNILQLKKGQKKNFYGCMATGASFAIDRANPGADGRPQMPLLQIRIYRDKTEAENPTQNFDAKTNLIDGRFLVDKKSPKQSQFYFRTILKEISDNKKVS